MGRARAAIVVVVAIAAVSAIVLLSPSPRPLTAPLCDKQPGNGEERSAAIGQAVERALRDAPGDPKIGRASCRGRVRSGGGGVWGMKGRGKRRGRGVRG